MTVTAPALGPAEAPLDHVASPVVILNPAVSVRRVICLFQAARVGQQQRQSRNP